jgi:hypothetical protein
MLPLTPQPFWRRRYRDSTWASTTQNGFESQKQPNISITPPSLAAPPRSTPKVSPPEASHIKNSPRFTNESATYNFQRLGKAGSSSKLKTVRAKCALGRRALCEASVYARTTWPRPESYDSAAVVSGLAFSSPDASAKSRAVLAKTTPGLSLTINQGQDQK